MFVSAQQLKQASIKNIIVIMLSLNLITCGFHLRGNIELPQSLQILHLSGTDSSSLFIQETRKVLLRNGITVVNSASEANYTLFILNESADKRIIALANNFRDAAEFELIIEIEAEVLDREGYRIMMPQRISARRIFTNDENQTRAKEREEAQLLQEIRRDIVQQLLRQIQSIPSDALPKKTASYAATN